MRNLCAKCMDFSVKLDTTTFKYTVSRDIVVLACGLQAAFVVAVLMFFVFMPTAFHSATDFVSASPILLIALLVLYVAYVFMGKMCVQLAGKGDNLVYRFVMIVYTILMASALFATKIKLFFLMAPLLVFDLLAYVYASLFVVKGTPGQTAVDDAMRADQLDVGALLTGLSFPAGTGYIDANRLLYRLQAFAESTANQSKCSLKAAATAGDVPFDYAKVIAFFAVADGHSPGSVGVAQFARFVQTKYDGMPTVPFSVFTDDTRAFAASWDGINSTNYGTVDVYALVNALKSLGDMGYVFFDLRAFLERLDATPDPIGDYGVFVAIMGSSTADPGTVSTYAFQGFCSKYIVTLDATLAELTAALITAVQAACASAATAKCDALMPYTGDTTVNAFDLADAVAALATDNYSKYVDVGLLLANIESAYNGGATYMGASAIHDAVCVGAGTQQPGDTTLKLLDARAAILNVVLTRATMIIREFIPYALVFALHSDDAIANDALYTQFYTDASVITALRDKLLVAPASQRSVLEKVTKTYTQSTVKGTTTGNVVFYATDTVDLNGQMAAFEEEKQLKEQVITFTYT